MLTFSKDFGESHSIGSAPLRTGAYRSDAAPYADDGGRSIR
jgi:hypothetical protein